VQEEANGPIVSQDTEENIAIRANHGRGGRTVGNAGGLVIVGIAKKNFVFGGEIRGVEAQQVSVIGVGAFYRDVKS